MEIENNESVDTKMSTESKKPKRKTKCKYLFVLKNIDVMKIYSKYGIPMHQDISGGPPINTTQIKMLEKEPMEMETSVNYLDETKKLRSCIISKIDFTKKNICCWWCKSAFDGPAWACPIDIKPLLVEKRYTSAISKSPYSIIEKTSGVNSVPSTCSTADEVFNSNVPPEAALHESRRSALHESRRSGVAQKNPSVISYITEGIFCSINCCVAWVNENSKRDVVYRDSPVLLTQMYNFILNTQTKFHPLPPSAPHWKMLDKFGGNLTLEDFRQNTNKISYVYQGKSRVNVSFSPLATWYEENLKF